MDWNDLLPIEQLDVLIIHLALIGQTIFLVMWTRLAWWKEWIGRALFVNSFALWLLIIVAIALFWAFVITDGIWKYSDHLTVFVHFVVVFGIFSQVGALAWEEHSAKVEDRRTFGTNTRLTPGVGSNERQDESRGTP